MKTPIARLLLPILGLGLITLPGLKAQDQGNARTASTEVATTDSASQGGQCRGGWNHHRGDFANLTPEERQQLKVAMDKIKGKSQLQAAQEAAKQAMENLRQTRNQLLLQADPNIQPILNKLQAAHTAKGPGGGASGGEPTPTSEAN
jgi:hypothetical protein